MRFAFPSLIQLLIYHQSKSLTLPSSLEDIDYLFVDGSIKPGKIEIGGRGVETPSPVSGGSAENEKNLVSAEHIDARESIDALDSYIITCLGSGGSGNYLSR